MNISTGNKGPLQISVQKLLWILLICSFTLMYCSEPPSSNEPTNEPTVQADASGPDAKCEPKNGQKCGPQGSEQLAEQIPDQVRGNDTKAPLPEQAPEAPQNTDNVIQPDEATSKPTNKKIFGGSRPATLNVPKDYDAKKSYPLLVVLHGYGASGIIQSTYLGLNRLVDDKKILMIAPDGTQETVGQKKRFWNATDACCNFYQSKVDDVAYIKGLVEEISKSYNVDRKKVFLLGHSNGGFMSYRMACEASDVFAGIVSLAGAMYKNTLLCKPKNSVSILQIHGTQDGTVKYLGGKFGGILPYPSATESVTAWAGYNKCKGKLEDKSPAYDLDDNLKGSETTRKAFGQCPQGIGVALWTIQAGGHIPRVTPGFADKAWEWLNNHPKP